MKRFKKVVRKGKCTLNVLVMVALLIGASGFSSKAASDILMDNATAVEYMEATIVEEPNLSGEGVPYTMLVNCIIGVSKCSEGMAIDISTETVGKSSVLGVKDVKVLKKTWYGGWETVAVSDGGEVKDRTTMGISLVYKGAVEGATYKITCVHYGNVNGYIEGENDSGEFVYSF